MRGVIIAYQRAIPSTAETGGPVDTVARPSVLSVSGGETCGWRVLVGETEMIENKGDVVVEVIVFELEVVCFAVMLRDWCGLRAEAEGADEVVAGVRGCSVGKTLYFAYLDLGGSGGVDGCERGQEREGCDDGSDGRHCGLLQVDFQRFWCGGSVADEKADWMEVLILGRISNLVLRFPSHIHGSFERISMSLAVPTRAVREYEAGRLGRTQYRHDFAEEKCKSDAKAEVWSHVKGNLVS